MSVSVSSPPYIKGPACSHTKAEGAVALLSKFDVDSSDHGSGSEDKIGSQKTNNASHLADSGDETERRL
jgi:hypothetical protein